MIKNLIFDFGKVLVDYEYFETLDQIFAEILSKKPSARCSRSCRNIRKK